jgi:hypothetical protein
VADMVRRLNLLDSYLEMYIFAKEESPLFVLQLCFKFTFSLKTSVWFKTDLELSKSTILGFPDFLWMLSTWLLKTKYF